MTAGIEVWGPMLVQAAASIGSGVLAGKGNAGGNTKMQKKQNKLVDQLLSSLDGNGPYSDLYSTNPETFQKSFVEPAQAMFRNQIAPQIQQQYIASGQQRGTGLDDQLLRAGVDMDAMLNQYLYQSQNDAANRKQNTINSILGAGSGAPNQTSTAQDIMSGAAGYFSSEGFANSSANLFKKPQDAPTANAAPARKGYERDYNNWQLGDSRWGS